MKKKIIVEFMVEENAHYNADMPYKIVETYCPSEYGMMGYDIYQVEADNISDVHVIFGDGIEYIADDAIICKDGDKTIYYVNSWSPLA